MEVEVNVVVKLTDDVVSLSELVDRVKLVDDGVSDSELVEGVKLADDVVSLSELVERVKLVDDAASDSDVELWVSLIELVVLTAFLTVVRNDSGDCCEGSGSAIITRVVEGGMGRADVGGAPVLLIVSG